MNLAVQLKSYTLCGSGEGRGLIDSDIVFDRHGIPFIPGRRVKGLLRESALEVLEMLGIGDRSLLEHLFGGGGFAPGAITVGNLHPEGRDEIAEGIERLRQESEGDRLLTPAAITDHYTTIRQQTRINDHGIAADTSLRTIRTINPDTLFCCRIDVSEDEGQVALLSLAALNLRRIGSSRNRGYGEVLCKLEGAIATEKCQELISGWRKPALPELSRRQSDAIPRGGSMKKLSFAITTTRPVVVTTLTGDDNTVNSADIIGSQMVRGILAARIGSRLSLHRGDEQNDPLFRQAILDFSSDSGMTVSSALPEIGGKRYSTPPMVLQRSKGDHERSYNIALIEKDDTAWCRGLANLESGSISRGSVRKTLFFHSTRGSARSEGRSTSDDGAIFYYEAIEAGTRFSGDLYGPEELLKQVKELCGDSFDCAIGRSRSAQYGSALFSFGKIAENDRDITAEGDELAIICRSPLLLRNDKGAFSPSVRELEKALTRFFGVSVEVTSSYVRSVMVGGFNSAIGCRTPAADGFAEGSTFILRITGLDEAVMEKKMSELAWRGLGERTTAGYGQVEVAPEWMKKEFLVETGAIPTVPKPFGDGEPVTPHLKAIIVHAVNMKLSEEMRKQALERADNYRKIPKNHQIGRLEAFVTSSDGKLSLEKKLKLLRKTASDELEKCKDRNNRSLLEALQEFDVEAGNFREDLLNKAKTVLQRCGVENAELTPKEGLAKEYWIAALRQMRKLNKSVKEADHA